MHLFKEPTKGLKTEFAVSLLTDNHVRVRWTRPLGRPMSAVYQALLEALEEIDGVETMTMGRYTADILVADHVVSDVQLAATAAEVLVAELSGGELGRCFRMQFIEPVWDVKLLLP